MGWKSTQRLTRQDAEARYVSYKLADEALARSFRAEAVMLNDEDLENELEHLAEKHGNSGYNYLITEFTSED